MLYPLTTFGLTLLSQSDDDEIRTATSWLSLIKLMIATAETENRCKELGHPNHN